MFMKIQYASDLHLELVPNARYMKSNPLDVVGDVLVLAGDICNLKGAMLSCAEFLQWASVNYREVLVVPGNHEYFHDYDMLAHGDSWSMEILPNVHYHQNRVVRIDNVDFVLSTMWSHIPVQCEEVVYQAMPDFRQIIYGDRRLTPADFNVEHDKSVAFIKRSVAESTAEHIVVVTHHLPSLAVVAPKHKGSLIGSAFVAELGDFIADSGIDAWIFGHSHASIEVQIGDTLLLSNQFGYVYNCEHLNGFEAGKFIEL